MSNARTFPTLAAAKAEYPDYVPFEASPAQTPQNGQPTQYYTQYYKPFEGSEPWDCACVAIWELTDGRGCAEEY